MKKQALTMAFMLTFLFVAAQFVSLGEANFYAVGGTTPPPEDTQPPTISMLSPRNDTALATKNVILSFTANVGESTTPYATKISSLRYKADWQQTDTVVYADDTPNYPRPARSVESSCYLQGIPDGSHSIVIYATETGLYSVGYTLYDFAIGNSWTVNFAIDTASPRITVLSPQNKEYGTSNVPLELEVSEPISKVLYSLDGQANVTVAANVTLAGLSAGVHNVTVYAWDSAGNVGASQSVRFTVDPFLTTLVAGVIVGSAAVVSFGLVAYFLRRKTQEKKSKPRNKKSQQIVLKFIQFERKTSKSEGCRLSGHDAPVGLFLCCTV